MVSAAPFSSMWRFMKLTGRGLGADGQDALAARGHTIVGMVAMCSGHPARGDAGGGKRITLDGHSERQRPSTGRMRRTGRRIQLRRAMTQ